LRHLCQLDRPPPGTTSRSYRAAYRFIRSAIDTWACGLLCGTAP
jgi:hypothetical protein